MADYYEGDANVPMDGRSAQFSEWLDLDNKVRALEEERRVIGKKLDELIPRLNKASQRLVNMIQPMNVVAKSSGDDDW